MDSKYINGAFVLVEGPNLLLFNPHLSSCAVVPLVGASIEETIRTHKADLIEKCVLLQDVEPSINYNGISDFFTKRDAYNTNTVYITDAMSFECNFNCVYCMQQNTFRDVTPLSPKDRVLTWEKIRHSLNSQNIVLYLFGGEPFYSTDYLEELLETAANMSIPISSICAITNGSLANDKLINIIRKFRIQSLQITLDGPKNIHDIRRVSKDGTSSFDTIMKNIDVFLHETTTRIIINTVLDKQNCNHYTELIDDLISRFPQYIFGSEPRISFNLGNECHPYNQSEYTRENMLVSNDQEVFFENLFALFNKGVCVNSPFPTSRCIATSVNEIVLGPNGDVYQCISGLGDIEFLVSKYSEYCEDGNKLLLKQLIYKKPERTAHCDSCNNFALCNGGCKYSKVVEKRGSTCQIESFSLFIDYYVRIAVHIDEIFPTIFRLKEGYKL